MHSRCLPACVLSLITACSGVASAADQLEASLLECRQHADHQVRLDCYDQLADRSAPRGVLRKDAPDAEQVQVADGGHAEDIAAAEEGAERRFGLRDPGAADGAAAGSVVTPEARAILDAARQPEEITSRVVRTERTRHGRMVIHLENEQVWAETSASRFRGEIPEGAEATVSKEGLNWFRMRFRNIDGVVAVRRVR